MIGELAEPGIDYCLERIRAEGLVLPKPPDLVRFETLRALSGVGVT